MTTLMFLLLAQFRFPRYHETYVRDCRGHFIAIYADKQMTQQLANPLYTPEGSRYIFYTGSPCIQVEVK